VKYKIDVINKFLKGNSFAFFGVSAVKNKFGNIALKQLVKGGYKVYPVHNDIEEIDGVKCFKDVFSIGEKPSKAIIMLSPENTEKVLPEIAMAGIKKVWIQQKSESEKAIAYCKENGIEVIHGQCILMFTEPVSGFHKFHRWISRLTGSYPSN